MTTISASDGIGASALSSTPHRRIQEAENVVIRFVGDSGDGMQLTGSDFARIMGRSGHDFATHPDYPPEISAPTGTLFGVSGFQVQLASGSALTSGDQPDLLVVMNPAALATNLPDAKSGGTLIVNSGAFTASNLEKAGYASNPLDDGSLADYRVFAVDMAALTAQALASSGLGKKEISRCKNYFALGLMLSLFGESPDEQIADIRSKFGNRDPAIADANIRALSAGYAYGDATEMIVPAYHVPPAHLPPGKYRTITGNQGRPWVSSQPRSAPASRSFSAPTRLRRPPISCMSCRCTKISRSRPSRPRTKLPRFVPPLALPTAVPSA